MSAPASLTVYRLTDHARLEMARRHITEMEISRVLANPEQIEMIRPGRAVYQSRLEAGEPAIACLLRIFVDIDRQPPEVVTAYRTGKIAKYWRTEP